MSFDLQLAGLRALVTGGTKGVGAAVVKGLSEAGVQVTVTARSLPVHPIAGVRYLAADLSTAQGAADAVDFSDQLFRAGEPYLSRQVEQEVRRLLGE